MRRSHWWWMNWTLQVINDQIERGGYFSFNFFSRTPEQFCMRRFAFMSSTVHRAHAMKKSDLENMAFNKVHLHYVFDNIKFYDKLNFWWR